MSLRNFDSSQLTKLKADRNQANFFSRQNALTAAAAPGTVYPTFNPQTGNYDSSKFVDIKNGSGTTYARAFGTTIVSVPCACADALVEERQ